MCNTISSVPSVSSLRFVVVSAEFDASEELMDAVEASPRPGPCDGGIERLNRAASDALWTLMQPATRAERLAAVVALRRARNAAREDSSRVCDNLLAGLTVWGNGRAPDTDAWGCRDYGMAPQY
jgi:hypothetical protein